MEFEKIVQQGSVSLVVALFVQAAVHILTQKRARTEATRKRISEVVANVVKSANELQAVVIEYLTAERCEKLKEEAALARSKAISMRLELLKPLVSKVEFQELMDVCLQWQSDILGAVPREQSAALSAESSAVVKVIGVGPWFEVRLESWVSGILSGIPVDRPKAGWRLWKRFVR